MYEHQQAHDPRDLAEARRLAQIDGRVAIGLLYRNPDAPRYDLMSSVGVGMARERKLAALSRELDRFAI